MKVTLDVGGTLFCTSYETLRKCGHVFFSRVAEDAAACASNTTFIDRDPTHFRIILNYLRDTKCIFPGAWSSVAELAKEAHYYQLTELECEALAELHRLEERESARDRSVSDAVSALRSISNSR